MRIPPKSVCKRLNTPAPIMRVKKNSFRSAPMRVRGRLRDRKTGLCLRSMTLPSNSERRLVFLSLRLFVFPEEQAASFHGLSTAVRAVAGYGNPDHVILNTDVQWILDERLADGKKVVSRF